MYNTRAVRDKKGRILHEVRADYSGCNRLPESQASSSSLAATSAWQQHFCSTAAAAVGNLWVLGCVPTRGHAAADTLQASSLPLTACTLLPNPPPPNQQDLQSKELPTTRIQPDRRWFGNTRVIGQKQLEEFREEMSSKINDAYTVLLREKKLPLQLLEDPERKVGAGVCAALCCACCAALWVALNAWLSAVHVSNCGGAFQH